MSGPRHSDYPVPTERAVAVFEAVPADKSETGRDEIYIVLDGEGRR